ncbi:MAG: hypothetical protein GY830_02290 [Bacteroidetes bacterium]|nr:hypothetical protein [Bacteroidota bacterium]
MLYKQINALENSVTTILATEIDTIEEMYNKLMVNQRVSQKIKQIKYIDLLPEKILDKNSSIEKDKNSSPPELLSIIFDSDGHGLTVIRAFKRDKFVGASINTPELPNYSLTPQLGFKIKTGINILNKGIGLVIHQEAPIDNVLGKLISLMPSTWLKKLEEENELSQAYLAQISSFFSAS